MVDVDKEICAKFVRAKELYLMILNLRLKPNLYWEEKWKTILGKDEIEWSQLWQNLHKNKINYNVQSTIWLLPKHT